MTRHKLNRNEFRLDNGSTVSIEYWIDANKVHVAAFDTSGRQASVATYSAAVDAAGELNPKRQDALVDSLANALEYALIRNPELHVRSR